MLACLISIQAHSFLPHHHHERSAPNHNHADHGDSVHFDGAHYHDIQLDHPDHEVNGHDEASLSGVTAPKSFHFDFVMALPEPVQLIPAAEVTAERAESGGRHPFATGPPGTKSSRAPPASFSA